MERAAALMEVSMSTLSVHRAHLTLCNNYQCFAMLEIALTPYKVKTGKKGKGASPSTVPQPVSRKIRT